MKKQQPWINQWRSEQEGVCIEHYVEEEYEGYHYRQFCKERFEIWGLNNDKKEAEVESWIEEELHKVKTILKN
jgi:hypothetical protein